MLYRAKELVSYDGIPHQIGDTFEVTPEDAGKFGWDKKNAIVELVETGEYVPEVPVTAPEAPQVASEAAVTPADEPTPAEGVTVPTSAPEAPQVANGDGDINNA